MQTGQKCVSNQMGMGDETVLFAAANVAAGQVCEKRGV
jgi:hypothetical protein